MKRASEVAGLKVLGIMEGQENGNAQDFMVDPQTKRVEYLVLKTNHGYGFNALKVSDVMGIGADYIMTKSVENAKKMYESKEILEQIERGFFMLGTTVLSAAGDVVGKVGDFSFDEKEGTIGTLYLDDQTEIEGSRIVAMAGKMVFVGADGVSLPVTEPEPVEKVEQPRPEDAFEKESFGYLMGKTTKDAIASEDGSFRIEAGTVLTADILKQAARFDDVLLALTLNV